MSSGSRSNDQRPLAFASLGHYHWPGMPAQRRLQWLWQRLARELGRKVDAPLVTDDDMDRLSAAQMDARVPWPPYATLIDELEESVADTTRGVDGAPRCRVVVLPPGDGADDRPGVLQGWAEQQGHALLEPPQRLSVLDGAAGDLPSLEGEGVLVIPDLAAWFVRHGHGLVQVRRLVDLLNALDRPTIVGCNSWGWAFLNKAMNIGLRLPEPLVPQAHGAERLRVWFANHPDDHAGGSPGEGFVFRRSDTGAAVLATDDDGKRPDDYLQSLAAHSLGIPWVAWHVFRRVQRSMPEGKSVDEANSLRDDPQENTAWLAAFPTFTLPPGHEPAARLLLHAVLLHGSLCEESLQATLPMAACRELVSALLRTGHLRESPMGYQCAPVAYPGIRQTLSEAGFPLDVL